MLFTTLRQLASISGRTIVAIGLTSAAVLALAPSAKADTTTGTLSSQGVSVTNPPYRAINSYTANDSLVPNALGVTGTIGTLNVSANTTFKIQILSTAGAVLTGPGSSNTVAYQLKVSGVTTGTPNAVLKDITTSAQDFYLGTTADEALSNEDLTVGISSTADFTHKRAGAYTDTLTFSIIAQ
ncbi:hypothetical protein [Pseudanabaena yagii]|uniref:Spore coat protein U domain-containing protein n=1 Tax=Pseudanabaena yagii GIHE-NHR1 TaxID=2722753 RepID=A0ABX1LYR6_9CYAN|nr:hypothetical protein [Pseudanabaena yagii]NMF60496.1 hypothetical protein [Pseudanabaena yagii GIHE-NHR1]